MTIQKIFSNQSDEEKYYSVLMSEEELKLFSGDIMSDDEFEKTNKKILKHGTKAGAGIATGGIGAILTAHLLGAKAAKHYKARAVASGLASIGGFAYGAKKLHDVHKVETDPRFAKKFEKELMKATRKNSSSK